MAAELDRALRARGGGRPHRPRGWRPSGGRDWEALSEAVRKRYTGAGITREAYESRRRPRAGEGAPVVIAVCVLLLAAIVVARIALALLQAHQFLAGLRGRVLAVVALAQCAGRCGWGGACRGTGPG